MVGGPMSRILQAVLLMPFLSRFGKKKMHFFIAKVNSQDLTLLKDLLETRKIATVIDRRYPLSEVAEAVRYREEGHVQGKVIITVDASPSILTWATPKIMSSDRLAHRR